MYVKLNSNHQPSKFPYNSVDLRKDNPGTSFPKDVTDEIFASYGVVPVVETTAPNFDSKTHSVTQDISLVGSDWTQSWTVEQLPEDIASENVRGRRNHLLKKTDYTQLADAPGDTAAWATYRQALRDIPAQDGFPFTVTWPTEPS
jgi:hypothetical protein